MKREKEFVLVLRRRWGATKRVLENFFKKRLPNEKVRVEGFCSLAKIREFIESNTSEVKAVLIGGETKERTIFSRSPNEVLGLVAKIRENHPMIKLVGLTSTNHEMNELYDYIVDKDSCLYEILKQIFSKQKEKDDD